MTPLRILCVCNGGNCRSVALAEVFKGQFGQEAIAAGTYWIRPQSMRELCCWADWIVVVEPREEAQLPEPDLTRWKESTIWEKQFDHMRRVLPIGPDRWGHDKWEELKLFLRPIATAFLSSINGR